MIILIENFRSHDMKRFFRKKLPDIPLDWHYTARGQIWRLLPSDRATLVLEERDTERKVVLFTSVDATSGSVVWTTENFLTKWWCSIETIHRDVLLLHEYAAPDMPDHKSVIALNLSDGKMIWANSDMRFLFAHADAIYTAKDTYDSRSFFEVEISTGKVLREIDDGYLSALRSSIAGEASSNIDFPNVYPGGAGSRGETEAILRRNFLSRPGVDSCEYIHAPAGVIVGWYERLEPENHASLLMHRLSIVRESDGTLLYEDELDAQARLPVPDLFFCRESRLFYIRNKNTVCSVNCTLR